MEIDARGYACPKPVIMTKRAISKSNAEELLIKVDNEVATENLKKMADQLGYKASVIENSKSDYEVHLKKIEDVKNFENTNDEYVVIFSSDKLGIGEEEFSKKLMESFTYSLSEEDRHPKYILCYNYGVHLTTINEKTVEDFKNLEKKGTEILSCGLCLENYKLKDKLKIGEITNMYRICEIMTNYRVVKPC
ncbi:MAG: sulfurtransferase-like selenium metabolism protein YedF [Peptoniphilus sp.]|uniref:sulfurtransferase-like selenium metabolism protein YedF n=1 Tax=Peptoniphilus sp. TaxID=1971214 RepID=UPI0025EA283F|nr:sulfurtransferase-like selenium metabolism protein YedF [Peptoniphilus sp.]MCI5643127.1 sulfurtransferase-like selenium metabolism protein YedF [Peptoniphilus sp.]MDD7352254.1 sulfurtransferase-like selenium metabolism protein YedF [Peptoniphilaceae bacterium]MDY3902166.1 sulfurtransferase-like selenium metabolism protein YedF [Peptoniphilus sp.]